MPISNIQEARDDIINHFRGFWESQPSPPPVAYPNVNFQKPTDGSPYARLFVQHFEGPQVTLGSPGYSRYRQSGIVTIQIFTKFGRGLTKDSELVNIARNAFQGKSTGSDTIDFHNFRANEIGNSDLYWQTNVLVDFEYDMIA
jgi:hypothetical protein